VPNGSEAIHVQNRPREGLGRFLRNVVADAFQDAMLIAADETLGVSRSVGGGTIEITPDRGGRSLIGGPAESLRS
jgi:hypothetical protein